MKKLLFLIFLTLVLSCRDFKTKNTDMNNDTFEWSLRMSLPVGYPVRIYAGKIEHNFITGEIYWDREANGWGGTGIGESWTTSPPPKYMDIAWLSYAENCFYRIETPLDYDKMLKLVREGYEERTYKKEPQHGDYRVICVGLAPGGVVIVWLGGFDRMIEVGRYQAEKIEIPKPEGLDSHESLIFSEKHRKGILENDGIIPKEFREAHKGKPIPYGLWDDYRTKRFIWYPSFEIHDGGAMGDYEFTYQNGETFWTFYTEMVTLEDGISLSSAKTEETKGKPKIWYSKKAKDAQEKYPLLRDVLFYYRDWNGDKYVVRCSFDWDTILPAFEEVFSDMGEGDEEVIARLHFRINYPNTFFTVRLIGNNGKEKAIPVNIVDFYKVDDDEISSTTPFD